MNDDLIDIIRREFRNGNEARYIHRLHGVLLMLNGLSSLQAAKFLNEPQTTVALWMRKFRKHGIDGLREKERSGRPAILKPRQQTALKKALQGSPESHGLEGEGWTGELVSEYLRKRHKVTLTMRHCRRLLRTLKDGQGTE